MRYRNKNHEYFLKHFSEFVEKHGGEWVVIAGGKLIGFAKKELISREIKKARELFPRDIPLVSPIPKEEEMECIL